MGQEGIEDNPIRRKGRHFWREINKNNMSWKNKQGRRQYKDKVREKLRNKVERHGMV